MKTNFTRHQKVLLGQVIGSVAFAVVLMNLGSFQKPVQDSEIPSPFATEKSSPLAGSITFIGQKNGIDVDDIGFEDTDSELLAVDKIHFALTPSMGISAGAPLSVALTSGKRIFGYEYTSMTADTERLIRDEIAAGIPHTFAERFPGKFFVSAEQRAADAYIQMFEMANGITFFPLSSVTLDANARYIVIANDDMTRMTVRGLEWCGDDVINSNPIEECDDGIHNGEVCDNVNGGSCMYCSDQCMNVTLGGGSTGGTGGGGTTGGGIGPICGDGQIDLATETCDDADIDNGDGCSSMCQVESGYQCMGTPSICSPMGGPPPNVPVCGNGLIESGEQCDDGNTVNKDSCENNCQFPPMFL